MSAAHSSSLHPDEKIKAGKFGTSMTKVGFTITAVFMIISLIFGAAQHDHWKRFYYAYLTGWTFSLSICVGCLFIIIIHHLTRSRWSTVVRRLAECVTMAFPIIGVAGLGFILPMLAGYHDLYFWSHPDGFAQLMNKHLDAKASWLSPTFFAIRYVIYFVSYVALSRYFSGKSRLQDENGDPELSQKMRIAAGPGVIIYALTTIFVGFDLVMSLAPNWYSTIYSVNFFGGALIGAWSVIILLSLALQRSGRLVHSLNKEHYQDMGKWLFAWTFFWAYTAFSQFMLIWYDNIPEETVFYQYRMFSSSWQCISIAVGIGQWTFPFVFLMSRWTKRATTLLALFAVWQLAFHWLDIYWNIMPNIDWGSVKEGASTVFAGPLTGNPVDHHVGFSAVDITLFISMVGVLIAGIGQGLKGNLVPVKDPMLGPSLGFENY